MGLAMSGREISGTGNVMWSWQCGEKSKLRPHLSVSGFVEQFRGISRVHLSLLCKLVQPMDFVLDQETYLFSGFLGCELQL